MRVLYFSRDYTTHDRRFLLKLAESRHTIWFLRLEEDGHIYEQRPVPDNVRVVEWRGGRQPANTPEAWWALMPDFEGVLDRIRPDLVHAGPVQSCAFMAAVAGCHPLLTMSWGSDLLVDVDRDDMFRWMTRYTLKRSDVLVCDCRAVREKARQLTDHPDTRVVQFPWGIDLDRFHAGRDRLGLRARLGWQDACVILSTRSWAAIYGVDILLQAFRDAYVTDPRLRLSLLGGGPMAATFEQYIREQGLDDVIYRPGVVSHEQLPDYYRAADLYMSCTYSDGTSISLLEAMATGLPVVVSAGGGNVEWVVQGRNGWLAPAGDVAAFSQALQMGVRLSPRDRECMQRTNRKVAEERANWDANFALLMESYDRLEFSGVVEPRISRGIGRRETNGS
jgi:glycosyltransferase involved in cell wall biosynthesis